MPIRAVGFDIDGTLYPAGALYLRMLPRVVRTLRLFLAFSETRRRLRADARSSPYRDAPPASVDEFHRYQAGITASILGTAPELAERDIERYFYAESAERFSTIRMFPGVESCLDALAAAGLGLGVLSDFPCERKLDLLGLTDRFSVAITSESVGLVKPDRRPFDLLARRMSVRNEELLYVGNSEAYDVAGARSAGMKTAFISRSTLARRRSSADFSFGDYRELVAYALSSKDL